LEELNVFDWGLRVSRDVRFALDCMIFYRFSRIFR